MLSPSSVTPAAPLRGRDAELAALRRLLGAARRGAGGAVLVLGAPGTGKSALLDSAAACAGAPASARVTGTPRDAGPGADTGGGGADTGGGDAGARPAGDRFVVLRTRGAEVESHLPYA